MNINLLIQECKAIRDSGATGEFRAGASAVLNEVVAHINSETVDFSSTFCIRVNGGDEHTLSLVTGQYHLAAAAALALVDYVPQEVQIIKVWNPKLLPDYGPYIYTHDGHTVRQMHEAPAWMLNDDYMSSRLVKAPTWLQDEPGGWDLTKTTHGVAL